MPGEKVLRTAVRLKRRRRVRLRWLIVVGFLVWGGYEYWFVERPLLSTDAVARARVEAEVQAQTRDATALEIEIRALHTDSYIEGIAEKQYNLIRPGEILFSGTSGTKSSGKG